MLHPIHAVAVTCRIMYMLTDLNNIRNIMRATDLIIIGTIHHTTNITIIMDGEISADILHDIHHMDHRHQTHTIPIRIAEAIPPWIQVIQYESKSIRHRILVIVLVNVSQVALLAFTAANLDTMHVSVAATSHRAVNNRIMSSCKRAMKCMKILC